MKPSPEPVTEKNGEIIINLAGNAYATDWLNIGRLRKKAKAGDRQAQKKLKALKTGEMRPLC